MMERWDWDRRSKGEDVGSLRLQRKRRGFFAGSAPSAVAGQSTLEYILVLAAIIVAIIVAANTAIRPAVGNSLTESGKAINSAANKLITGLNLQ